MLLFKIFSFLYDSNLPVGALNKTNLTKNGKSPSREGDFGVVWQLLHARPNPLVWRPQRSDDQSELVDVVLSWEYGREREELPQDAADRPQVHGLCTFKVDHQDFTLLIGAAFENRLNQPVYFLAP